MGRETLTNLTAKFTQTTTPLTLIMGRFKVKIDFDALFLVGILSWNFLRNLQHIFSSMYTKIPIQYLVEKAIAYLN